MTEHPLPLERVHHHRIEPELEVTDQLPEPVLLVQGVHVELKYYIESSTYTPSTCEWSRDHPTVKILLTTKTNTKISEETFVSSSRVKGPPWP